MWGLFFFIFCFCICVCIWLQIQHTDPLQECHSIRLGSCGMIYYCAPLVRMPDVIGVLAVWRHNKLKKKNRRRQGRISHCTAHWWDLTEAIFWETLRVPVWSPKWSQKSIRVRRVKEWGVTRCAANVTLRRLGDLIVRRKLLHASWVLSLGYVEGGGVRD